MQRPRKVPLRKCIGCGQMFEKKSLTRIVLTPEGDIRFDETGKQSGRGAYLCHKPECLKQAQKRKALERALKCPVDAQIYQALMARMELNQIQGGQA